jgi:hypothetical protein
MLPFIGAVALLVLLGLLVLGERAFERGRRQRKAPKRLPPP